MGQRDVLQLRKHPRQRAAHEGPDVGREALGIGLAAAEQQAAVRRRAEVVQHELAVGRAFAAGQRIAVAQRLGGDDEVVERHDARRHAAVEPVEIAVAGQQHPVGAQRPLRGAEGHAVRPRLHRARLAALVQPHAGPRRGAGEAEGEPERVQMPALAILQPADIGRRADAGAGLVAVERADRRMAVARGDVLGVLGHLARVGLAPRRLQMAGAQLAVDGVVRDQALHQPRGLGGERPDPRRRRGAEAALIGADVDARAVGELAAIAPRRAPAEAVRLQQRHVDAAHRQMQRRREPGVAAPDHRHLGPGLAAERGALRRGAGGLGVEARGVDARPVVGVKEAHGGGLSEGAPASPRPARRASLRERPGTAARNGGPERRPGTAARNSRRERRVAAVEPGRGDAS